MQQPVMEYIQKFAQHVINRPMVQNLIKDPLILRYCGNKHKIFSMVSDQTLNIMKGFTGNLTHRNIDDSNNVTMTFLSDPTSFRFLLDQIHAAENDSMAFDDILWIYMCVTIMFLVTSFSWMAILLATYGTKYRTPIKVIGVLIVTLLVGFFLFFFLKLRSLGIEADMLSNFFLSCSYLPITFLVSSLCCAALYTMCFGMSNKTLYSYVKMEHKKQFEDKNMVLTLKEELKSTTFEQQKTLTDLIVLQNSMNLARTGYDIVLAEQESRLEVLNTELATAKAAVLNCESTQKTLAELSGERENILRLMEGSLNEMGLQLESNRREKLDLNAEKENILKLMETLMAESNLQLESNRNDKQSDLQRLDKVQKK